MGRVAQRGVGLLAVSIICGSVLSSSEASVLFQESFEGDSVVAGVNLLEQQQGESSIEKPAEHGTWTIRATGEDWKETKTSAKVIASKDPSHPQVLELQIPDGTNKSINLGLYFSEGTDKSSVQESIRFKMAFYWPEGGNLRNARLHVKLQGGSEEESGRERPPLANLRLFESVTLYGNSKQGVPHVFLEDEGGAKYMLQGDTWYTLVIDFPDPTSENKTYKVALYQNGEKNPVATGQQTWSDPAGSYRSIHIQQLMMGKTDDAQHTWIDDILVESSPSE